MFRRTLRQVSPGLRSSCPSTCRAQRYTDTRSRLHLPTQTSLNRCRSYGTSQNGDSEAHPLSPLPPHFFSLYRLFLRSTTASVLSHTEATSTLRSIWRPVFVQAATVMRQLERDRPSAEQREALTHWLTQWETRGLSTYDVLIYLLTFPFVTPFVLAPTRYIRVGATALAMLPAVECKMQMLHPDLTAPGLKHRLTNAD